MTTDSTRVVVWFSCGEASAVAAHVALKKYPETQVVYCNTLSSEHPDNWRFLQDVERWLGFSITVIGSAKYESVDDVFERERYMAGIKGARCTTEMKKVPRNAFQRVDDLHIFGYTADEPKRMKDFQRNNPELRTEWILGDNLIRKVDCARILQAAGIERPAMYDLGFEHNNCIGCVKATSPAYWQRVARLFPDVFKRRCEQSREIGARLIRVKGERVFLDELQLDIPSNEPDGDIECGPYCLQDNFELKEIK
jgi:hypothetical protein